MNFSTTRSKSVRILKQAAVPLCLILLWELVARTVLKEVYVLPPPSAIVAQAVSDFDFVLPNLATTARLSLLGWLIGNAIGIIAGTLFVLVSVLEQLLLRTFVALYCLPVVAIAPVLMGILPDGQPQVVLSAQGVFFTTLMAMMLGLRSADPRSLEMARVAGSGSLSRLVYVRLPSALPSLFSGLKIAAPAAVLGVVVAEYMGARRGLGVAMVYSSQSLMIERTWALALYTTLLAGAFYFVTALAARLLIPWVNQLQIVDLPPLNTHGSRWGWVLKGIWGLVSSILFILVIWQILIWMLGTNSFFFKGPIDIFEYLVTSPMAAAQRGELFSDFAVSMRDSLLGYIAGAVFAVLVAALVILSSGLRLAVMPIAVALRAVPLVALTPLFVLLFGRGFMSVVVIAGIVAFFPVLMPLVGAFDRTPEPALDLVTVSGGSRLQQLRHVMVPEALPTFFSSARVAAPTALIGALLAEWLATGEGLGSRMIQEITKSNFAYSWSAVLLVTLFAFLLYAIATFAEAAVLRRTRG